LEESETAKVEWHPGELYTRVGFIVTNLSRPAERIVERQGARFLVMTSRFSAAQSSRRSPSNA
jgi:hypothetical protein